MSSSGFLPLESASPSVFASYPPSWQSSSGTGYWSTPSPVNPIGKCFTHILNEAIFQFSYSLAPAVSPAHSGGSPGYNSSPGYSTHHLTHQYPTTTCQSDLYQPSSVTSQMYPTAPTHQVIFQTNSIFIFMIFNCYKIHITAIPINEQHQIKLYFNQNIIFVLLLIQIYHSSPSSPTHQIYGNVVSPTTITNLGYSLSCHPASDYGVFPNSYHYQSSEYIPIITDLRFVLI